MTKNDLVVLNRLRQNEDFQGLSIEQLLLECIDTVGLAETAALLAKTNWKKHTKRTSYNGPNKSGSKLTGLIVVNKKGEREIRFDVNEFDERVELVLRYL